MNRAKGGEASPKSPCALQNVPATKAVELECPLPRALDFQRAPAERGLRVKGFRV